MIRCRHVIIALLGLAAAPDARAQVPTPPPPPVGEDAARDQLRGTYVLIGSVDRGVEVRDAAIDLAVDGMFFAAKPIARRMLRERCRIDSAITLRIEDGVVRATTPENTPVVSREDGRWAAYRYGDEVLRISQKITPKGLVQTFVGPDGSRRNDLTLSADGRLLTLRVTVAGQKLPRPVAYELTYKRVIDKPLDL